MRTLNLVTRHLITDDVSQTSRSRWMRPPVRTSWLSRKNFSTVWRDISTWSVLVLTVDLKVASEDLTNTYINIIMSFQDQQTFRRVLSPGLVREVSWKKWWRMESRCGRR